MNLLIKDGVLYVDNLRFCLAEAGNGRDDLPTGRYEVATQYATVHGKVLPDALGLGWLGATYQCDCVLGSVRGRAGVLPSQGALSRLLALLEVAEGNGQSVWLEVMK
jgi:hypothetical protein